MILFIVRVKKEKEANSVDFHRLQEKVDALLQELKKAGLRTQELPPEAPEHPEEQTIPVTIFTKTLSPLETIVKYLKENRGLSYTQIAVLIGRKYAPIVRTYQNARKKNATPLTSPSSPYTIPLSIFVAQHLSVLESIVSYLKKNYGLALHEIAILLHRDDRTVWTVYHRAQQKRKAQGGGVA